MSTLLVATTGGHLTQLVDIAARLPEDHDGERLWVTHENAQSRSLLNGERVMYVPYVGVKDVPGVLRNVPVARRLLGERCLTRAVSTGSGIALGFLPYLAARGVGAHYIESAARVNGPSLSGRILRVAPRVRLYTQYRQMAHGRWRYGGSVFDGYRPLEPGGFGAIRRAVVTLGTAAEFPFRRLLDALVPLLGAGGALEREQGQPVDTLWQTGGTPTEGLRIHARPWLPAAELGDALAAADLVVSHAGVGSCVAALNAGRCPVLVPREAARSEVGDDHQAQVAHELATRGLAVHRSADKLTVADVLLAGSRRVERVGDPPTFELVA
jgi:UDP-N-acetylglucosamine--N-acetylmuramyl-(pentapeptide) pyrophosphoryl-undecaprenol N-acetylglucosamine transferase